MSLAYTYTYHKKHWTVNFSVHTSTNISYEATSFFFLTTLTLQLLDALEFPPPPLKPLRC